MKTSSVLIMTMGFSLLLLGCGEKVVESLQERDGLFYAVNEDKGFTGRFAEYWDENGQKISETNYKEGKKDWLETLWHENGQKKQEMNYKNGELHGLWTEYRENGSKFETNYKNGKKDGLSTLWGKSGEKLYETNYKNGKRGEKLCCD